MPILANLSRRIHMLTTDAKPDPPRTGVNGYTHNLESNRETEETKRLDRGPNASEEERSEEARSETATRTKKEASSSNNATPTNTCSTSEKCFNGNEPLSNSASEEKPRTGKTRTKSKQYRHSQSARVINYNIVNSNGVKLGSRTTYVCNINHFPANNAASHEESCLNSEVRQMPADVERLCSCTDQLTLEDIFIVKTHVGHGWKDVARKLLYSDGQIEQFEENYRFKGISEVVYQIFIDWKQANTSDAQIGRLIHVLWSCQEYDCVDRLISSRKNSI